MAPRKKKNSAIETEIDKSEENKQLLPEAQEELTPSEYFNILNEHSAKASSETLQKLYQNTMKLMKKYQITGQKKGALKLYNFARLCEKELRVLDAGIDTYVERQDVDEYISKIAKKSVVIIELENYERDIPDDIVEEIARLKQNNIFDAYFIVFTDYTGKERKKVEEEKREKDPILFGALKIGDQISTRLDHIASWEDEYCDLTLDKMVKEYAKNHDNANMESKLSDFGSLDEFKNSFNEHLANT